jgi:hypothetical protein
MLEPVMVPLELPLTILLKLLMAEKSVMRQLSVSFLVVIVAQPHHWSRLVMEALAQLHTLPPQNLMVDQSALTILSL